MANWNYDATQYEERDFTPLKAGDYRVRIEEVVEKVSRNGNEMFELTLSVSGHNSKLWHYIVLMPSNPQITNQKLGELFNCFNITDTNLNNFKAWEGKVGACRVKTEKTDDGGERAVIHYLIKPEKALKLPAWEEPGNSNNGGNGSNGGFVAVTDDIPF